MILRAHMLEVSHALTAAKLSFEIHALGIGSKDNPERLVFNADAGRAVVVGMSEMRDRCRLVENVVEVVVPPEALPKLLVGRAVWKPESDYTTSATAWRTAGAAHHTMMTAAVGIEV